MDKQEINRAGQRGFTLIELMVAVVIVGILSSIAVPSYTDYVTKSRRAQAKAMLMDIMTKQEQFMLDNKTYARALTSMGYSNWYIATDEKGEQSDLGADTTYLYLLSPDDAKTSGVTTGWTLRGYAWGKHRLRDLDCQVVAISSKGEKTATGANTDACW